eukprot:scaffold445_cov198-Prasinococcus_capsulatus_cf.AAC.2
MHQPLNSRWAIRAGLTSGSDRCPPCLLARFRALAAFCTGVPGPSGPCPIFKPEGRGATSRLRRGVPLTQASRVAVPKAAGHVGRATQLVFSKLRTQ